MEIILKNINDLSPEEYAEGFERMSAERQEKCRAFRFEDDKKRCVLADMIIRSKIEKITGIAGRDIIIRLSPRGKPYVDFPGVYFSPSHSKELVGVAFSQNEIGFDIENIKPVKEKISKYFCSEADLKYIFGAGEARSAENADPDTLRRFFEVWTFKEAYVKYTGEGISEKIRYMDFNREDAFLDYVDGYVMCAYPGKIDE